MIAYENLLKEDRSWGFREGSMHFEKESAVHKTLQRIIKRLEELNVPYAVVGAMAMFFHGYQRFTTDIDILVRPDGLKKIHQRLEGLGYLPPYQGSKHLRDADSGVRIEFLTTGDFPGDGKPKPVAFPDPETASVDIDGIRFLSLPALIELKLASGMTNPGRLKDLGDVQEMIRALSLPEEMADRLNPFVRDKFKELWAAVRNNPAEP
ncbi:MAG: nucleotidyltransferase family protein [Gemmataceae bacterium]